MTIGSDPDLIAVTPRTSLRRVTDRGSHERDTVNAILDAALVCHVATQVETGPVALPMAFARVGDEVYVHGSTAAGMLRALRDGRPACLTATVVDGLVLSRSAFHHSLNYRCAVVFGGFGEVEDPAVKSAALAAIVDHMVAGRSADCRPPTDKELRTTLVLSLRIDEASAKVRVGGPREEPDDLALPYWGGHLPLALLPCGPAVPDVGSEPHVAVPSALVPWTGPEPTPPG